LYFGCYSGVHDIKAILKGEQQKRKAAFAEPEEKELLPLYLNFLAEYMMIDRFDPNSPYIVNP
jgi:hypothetical protein